MPKNKRKFNKELRKFEEIMKRNGQIEPTYIIDGENDDFDEKSVGDLDSFVEKIKASFINNGYVLTNNFSSELRFTIEYDAMQFQFISIEHNDQSNIFLIFKNITKSSDNHSFYTLVCSYNCYNGLTANSGLALINFLISRQENDCESCRFGDILLLDPINGYEIRRLITEETIFVTNQDGEISYEEYVVPDNSDNNACKVIFSDSDSDFTSNSGYDPSS